MNLPDLGLPDIGLLNCFYSFLLLVGVFYAFITFIAGSLHSIHLPTLDVDLSGLHLPGVGHIDIAAPSGHEVSLLSLSPISIAAFITSFGGIGLIATQAFHVESGASLLWAVGGAIVIALISHVLFFYIFIAPQASSAVTEKGMMGLTAEVITPIAEKSVGEIAYVAMGERHTAVARSADGSAIPRGAAVVIERLSGAVLVVRPASTEKH